MGQREVQAHPPTHRVADVDGLAGGLTEQIGRAPQVGSHGADPPCPGASTSNTSWSRANAEATGSHDRPVWVKPCTNTMRSWSAPNRSAYRGPLHGWRRSGSNGSPATVGMDHGCHDRSMPALDPAAVAATFCATLVDEWIRGGVRLRGDRPRQPLDPAGPGAHRPPRAAHRGVPRRAGRLVRGARQRGSPPALPAVLLCTSGTAATHFHGAVAEADLVGRPDARLHRRPARRSCTTSAPRRRSTRTTCSAPRCAGSTRRGSPTTPPAARGGRSASRALQAATRHRSRARCTSTSRSASRWSANRWSCRPAAPMAAPWQRRSHRRAAPCPTPTS